jgi:energy-coupling factor transporter ATP-binding protein EcfA2
LDLEPKAKGFDALAIRLDQAAGKCRTIEAVASDRAVDRLHELQAAVVAAIDADKMAQALVRGEDGDELEGTGSATWKTLFKAAQNFSIEVYSHADHHPATDADARCVLCQQPLAQSAKERLDRFRSYVASEAATALGDANGTLAGAIEKVANASTEVIDEATLAELRELDAATAELIDARKNAWSARKHWTADAHASGNWCCPRPTPAPQPSLSTVLAEKAQVCRDKATELRASKDEEQMRALAREKTGLVAKRNLATLLPQVEQYVHDSSKVKHLKSLEDQLQTKALSIRITKMSQQHITEALRQAMQEELARLGARSPKPVLKSRTSYGSNLMTLSLESTSKSPGAILSEGEQRAMGLALFLAEVRLRGDRSTLVFDDPSTSLDHRFRKKMAARLVELAKDRQVIVFTHDAVFLTQLRMAANAAAIEPKLQTVEWNYNRPGSVIDGLAWENEKFFAQLDRIRKQATDLAASCNDQLNDEESQIVRNLYGQLRGALERGIREVVLYDVVHPFADQVKIENVGAVIGFSLEDWKAIVELHDECSGVVAAHDTPSDSQQEIPHPSELLERLKAIWPVFERSKTRNSAFEDTTLKPHRAKRNALRRG